MEKGLENTIPDLDSCFLEHQELFRRDFHVEVALCSKVFLAGIESQPGLNERETHFPFTKEQANFCAVETPKWVSFAAKIRWSSSVF